MTAFSKKDLEHKLHIQHRNTRHDACDIVNAYQAEIDKENERTWKIHCEKSWNGELTIFSPSYKKLYMDANELTRRIHNMKQRKPKDEERK